MLAQPAGNQQLLHWLLHAAAVATILLSDAATAQMVHGTAVPHGWIPTYQMNRSTFLMTCNNSGAFDPVFASKWGVVDYDWCALQVRDRKGL